MPSKKKGKSDAKDSLPELQATRSDVERVRGNVEYEFGDTDEYAEFYYGLEDRFSEHGLNVGGRERFGQAVLFVVAKEFGASINEMLGKGRKNVEISRAKGAFFYIYRELTDASYANVGLFLNDDHTTVLYHKRKIESLDDSDPYKEKIAEIREIMLNNHPYTEEVREDYLRAQRKREDFPDPSQPRYAEVNRNDVQFKTRVEKEVAAAVEEFRSKSGMTKKAITEAALLAYIEENTPEN